MPTGATREAWESGAAYEPYVGRWSRLVAREFVAWLSVAPGGEWVDVGCGTGALTAALLADAAPASVRAIDASPGYVRHARDRIQDRRVMVAVADARALPWASLSADGVVSALVLNFVPEPERALAEMARVSRRGGVVAAYVWDYSHGMQFMRHFWDAAVALDPAAASLDEGARFPLCRPESLDALWRSCALKDVVVRAIDVPTRFRDFDDFWTPFLGGQGPAPSYLMSLDPDRRAHLRERLRTRLSVEADGTIALVARAWAVRGVLSDRST